MDAEIALWLQGLDELVEGQVLMRLRGQRSLAGLAQHLDDGAASVHAVAQHLGIDEEADQPFGLGAVPVGDGHAHTDVLLPAVAGQQRLPSRQQRHEKGRALGTGTGLQ
ncbi:hypothetical protein BW39_06019 [Delftia sp. RIT313]|nr:hypothetical protein BW39_06019 [Delftia sp. RIT313]